MAEKRQDNWVVDFPTIGFLAADWIEAHCVVPSGDLLGQPFTADGWQLWVLVNHYRIKTNAKLGENGRSNNQQFHYRRSLIVGPQKTGKSPLGASIVAFEAVGPALFAGWAKPGDYYACTEHGCPCPFTYYYDKDEPMGRPREKSLIQLLATAEEQVANVYEPLNYMVRSGHLTNQVKPTETYLSLPNRGKVEVVTQSARARLGSPINFALADETGMYTGKMKETWATMRRGLAGMGGRSLELTNPWDPMEASSAQETYEAHAPDVFVFYQKPDAKLDYRKKADRKKIHEFVYRGSPWVDLDSIEAEVAEIMVTNPANAERFFGNRLVQGLGSFMPEDLWDDHAEDVEVAEGASICIGFDGSRSNDWTALRACTIDGHRFTPTYGPDNRPTVWNPQDWDGHIPRTEVDAAVAELFAKYEVGRMYIDPRFWETQADKWALDYGGDRVITWPTNQIKRMFLALTRYVEDMKEGLSSHSDDATMKQHVMNARKLAKPGDMYILGKPKEHMKIDLVMADVLAYEAYADMKAEGWEDSFTHRRIFFKR